MPALLVPADRDVSARRDPARRRDPPRPERALVRRADRRDRALIAGYHYLIEWDVVEDNTCSLTGPSCAAVWFREFGFVTLAFMALVGFVTILALLFVRFPATLDRDGAHPPPHRPKQEVAP